MRAQLAQIPVGYAMSAILGAAAELSLFDHLEQPRDAAALAELVGARNPSGVARLCGALCALGLVERDAEGRFSARPAALQLLRTDREGSLHPVLLYTHRNFAPLMARLTDAVRRVEPQHQAWSFASADASEAHYYSELARHPGEYDVFLKTMDLFAVGVGTSIAQSVDLRDVRTLIDLGGGSGRVALELLAAAPHLTIELIDVPMACRMATQRAAEASVQGRFVATAGDFAEPLPGSALGPADAVLLSAILADWAPAVQAQILANAAALLRPGGLLLVSETLLADDRTGPLMPAILSLFMLASMTGDSFTLPELRALLQDAGFVAVEHHPPRKPGGRDLLLARTPQAATP
jgi:SAM-dependent methyltransferase